MCDEMMPNLVVWNPTKESSVPSTNKKLGYGNERAGSRYVWRAGILCGSIGGSGGCRKRHGALCSVRGTTRNLGSGLQRGSPSLHAHSRIPPAAGDRQQGLQNNCGDALSLSGLARLAFFGIETSQQIERHTLDSQTLGGVNGRHPAGGWDGVASLHCARVAFLNADRLGEPTVESFNDCGKGIHKRIATTGSDTCQHGM